MRHRLTHLGLRDAVAPVSQTASGARQLTLHSDALARWMPGFDTLDLAPRLGADGQAQGEALEREILVAMLGAPVPFVFPSVDELISHVRMRQDIVQAARRTALAFETEAAERPADCWVYRESSGFTLVPGHRLEDALVKATQPEATGRLYSFSCYRATEYVILLAIARELARSNQPLLGALESDARQRAIRSGAFHDTFLYEYGAMDAPLPPRYYVPGDRLWFRNPDERSADVAGFEGSWVFYEGGGRFSNFWKRDAPFTFDSKCVEIYHWRHGVREGAGGAGATMDEDEVARRVERSMQDPEEVSRILARMQRLRDSRGVYAEGGCIDTSREYPRNVRPGTADIVFPPPA
ncbi:MAG: hypothetical protein KA795_17765 [Burkholderiaceae bacterium]|nr:hypothetical protein [Burkholderiaceae bacterium]